MPKNKATEKLAKTEKIMKMRNNLHEMQKIQRFSKKMIKEYEDA